LALELAAEFPKENDERWIHFSHYNEDKRAITDLTRMPTKLSELVSDLGSPEFIEILQKLTGIKNLIADPNLQGGGIHQTKTGGFLNIHADFTVHPLNRQWRRRVNLLIYLTPDWQEGYEGHLELWSKDMKTCVHKISPNLNRCIIFNTDEDSYHGVPTPLNCPADITRNSIALYYYTDELLKTKLKATNYRARPSHDDNKLLIWLDKIIVAAYTRVKSKLRLSDQMTGFILKIFRRKN
jgi:Rps23 Pro-64 3,4-dihydroxylase Tpa1-like proline 4-hydroxylase